MREGIAQVKNLGGESDPVKHVIFGGKTPSHNPHELNKSINFFAQRLNDPQKEAIKFCLASNGILFIYLFIIVFFKLLLFYLIHLCRDCPHSWSSRNW